MSDKEIRTDCSYTADHEWLGASPESESKARRVGLTPYAADALGEVVFVKPPSSGQVVKTSAAVCEVEAAKALSDVHSPVDGVVVAVNEQLVDNPGLINSDPFGEGWLFEVEVEGDQNGADLLDCQAYRRLVEGD